jgi:hypothetical protein
MIPPAATLPDDRQRQSLKTFQPALACGAGHSPLRVPDIQSSQPYPLGGQTLAAHKLQPRQNPQGDRQQPDQAGGVIVPL